MSAHPRVRSHPSSSPSLAVILRHDPPSATMDPAVWLPRYTAAEVGSWFGDDFLAPLGYDPAILHGVPSSGARHHDTVSALAKAPNPLHVAAVYREREGGRRYAFWVPRYNGPRLLTGRPGRNLVGRLLLPAIPRSLRCAFRPPAGHVFLVADLRHCFLALLGTVSGDEDLVHAAKGDLHQEAGDVMVPGKPASERRALGKVFNSAVVGLISPQGWATKLRSRGIHVAGKGAQEMHHRWWARFGHARRFREAWVELHRRAAARGLPLALRYPDGRRFTFDAATVRGAARRPAWSGLHRRDQRLAASTRCTFSALWRGIEGVVLDETLHRVYPLRSRGLRLVVPMYDGLLLQAPTGEARALAACVGDAMNDALAAVGVRGATKVSVATTWAGQMPRPDTAGRCVM